MDQQSKIVHRDAADSLMLYNKLSSPTRKKLKRVASKAVRQEIRQRRILDD